VEEESYALEENKQREEMKMNMQILKILPR